MNAAAILLLDDPKAADPALVGAKAANLARARLARLPALPGVVLTTRWPPGDRAAAAAAWERLGGRGPVVVRSSSTGEDGSGSSMAGVFDSVLDVQDLDAFYAAVDTVVGSADAARQAGLVDAEMAVLVQPMVHARWGGVAFGADPATGRRDRVVVAATNGGPDALVSGAVDGWTGVLDRRGHVRDQRCRPDTPRPPDALLRRVVRLVRDAGRAYGGPQDIEWAVDEHGELVLLQARPITTLAPESGTVWGAGPVAESFPAPLAPLEQDLWLPPLRDGLREALRLTGTTTDKALRRSPVVTTVEGLAVVDLELLGVEAPRGHRLLRRLDPRPPARRLRAAWRVGRLRHAFVALAEDVVTRVDDDLDAVPALHDLPDRALLDVLRNGQRALVSLHGYEAIGGMLIPDAAGATVTGASLALSVLADAHAAGRDVAAAFEEDPLLLALVPPRIGEPGALDIVPLAPRGGDVETPHPAAVAREALRLRVRWVQELTARAAWTLAERLATRGLVGRAADARLLTLDELTAAVERRQVPADLHERRLPDGGSLPVRFRLDAAGMARAVAATRRSGGAGSAAGASPGVASGRAVVGATAGAALDGAVLVVSHLDPSLAPVLPRLAALVAETGSTLSHLAILAREHRVPVVIGMADATHRFQDGQLLVVDGTEGTVETIHAADHTMEAIA